MSAQSTDLQPLTDALIAVLRDSGIIGVQAVYLFGSWGTEFERAESDIDLAILAKDALDMEPCLSVAEMLGSQHGFSAEVDLIDLRSADTVFAAYIVTEARRLVVMDRNATEHFEALALAKYARLNEERAGILADIKLRGTVFKQKAFV